MKCPLWSVSAASILLLLAIAPLRLVGKEQCSRPGKTAERVLREFEHIHSIPEAHAYLQSVRPVCISPSLKRVLMARLPYAGDVGASGEGKLKLSALDPVLEYHGRKEAFEPKVVHAIQAFVGLHARCVLLISERALELLTAEEVRALVAHEIGHEYFWREYQSAAKQYDPDRMKEVELRCDAVAVFTLLQLGMNPDALLTGVSKQAGFNELVGATANSNCYVSMKERTRFVAALAGQVIGNSR